MRVLWSLFLAAVFLLGCSETSITQSDGDDQQVFFKPKMEDIRISKRADMVTVCHFPPGNAENPRVITVASTAVDDHVGQHEGDGIVGVDYDENCQPMGCPCWEGIDLADMTWTYYRRDEYTNPHTGLVYFDNQLGGPDGYASAMVYEGRARCQFSNSDGSISLPTITEAEGRSCKADMDAAAP